MMDKISILHVISSCDPRGGGPIEGIKQLKQHYTKNNINLEILTLDEQNSSFLKNKDLPKVHAVGKGIFKYRYNFNLNKWLKKNIKNYKCIVVDGIWQYHDYCVWKFATKYKIPYFVYPHGMLDPWFNKKLTIKYLKKKIYWRLFQYKILKDAKKIFFTNNTEQRLAKLSFKPYIVKSYVTGYGINGNQYLKSTQNLFYKKYKNLKGKKIFLYIGRIAEIKGIDILIKAFSSIKENNFRLIIVGNNQNKYASELKKIINDYCISKYIIWTGPLYGKIKWDCLRSADLVCLTSHQDSLGISVIESLSSGTPVLISNKVKIYNDIRKYKICYANKPAISDTINSFIKFKNNTIDKEIIKNEAIKCFKENFQMKFAANKLIKQLKFDKR